MELPRFCGHLSVLLGGVYDVENAETICTAVSPADDRDSGKHTQGLVSSEREELKRLRQENQQLKLEREILSKAAAWFAQESAANSKRSSNS